MARLELVALLLAAGVMAVPPAQARSDGGWFWEKNSEVPVKPTSLDPNFTPIIDEESSTSPEDKLTTTAIEELADDKMVTTEKISTTEDITTITETFTTDDLEEIRANKDKDGMDIDIAADVSVLRARAWMLGQKNAEWHWGEDTPRAIVALKLSTPEEQFNATAAIEAGMLERQFKLLLAGKFLAGNMSNLAPESQMLWVNGLLATCSDPRNFFGKDLLSSLETAKRVDWNNFSLFLTICNAGARFEWAHLVRLATRVMEETNTSPLTTEARALAMLCLKCVQSHHSNVRHLFSHNHESERLNKLLDLQNPDGSFGFLYTTALVLQALQAYRQDDSSPEYLAKIELTKAYLRSQQTPEGSFRDFMGTYLALPALAGRSLVNLGNISCASISEKVPPTKDRQINLHLEYDDISHTINLRALRNSSVLDILRMAKSKDKTFRFEVVEIGDAAYVYSMCEKPNDPEKGFAWSAFLAFSGSQKREQIIPHLEDIAKFIPSHSFYSIIYRYKKL